MSETTQHPENGLSNDHWRKQKQKRKQNVADKNSVRQYFGLSPT